MVRNYKPVAFDRRRRVLDSEWEWVLKMLEEGYPQRYMAYVLRVEQSTISRGLKKLRQEAEKKKEVLNNV